MHGLQIDLLAFQDKLNIDHKESGRYIFDPVRKTYIKVQPEELVRQCWIQYLMHEHDVTLASISVEKQIQSSNFGRRIDMVVYSRGKPKVLFEFKSFNAKINDKTCRQVAVYNMDLKVPFIVISNGIQHFAYSVNFEQREVMPMNQLPNLSAKL